jgi:hypothetical protein
MYLYRLLRDNKESGPYSATDLQSMGLKPYDLIWQEGKSAAWRYPGELDELKSFAPAVEEQPFDRFYKKPEATKQSSSQYAPKPAVTNEPKTQIQKGHIVVTMPSSLTKERTDPKPIKPEPVYQRQVQMSDESLPPVKSLPVNEPEFLRTPPPTPQANAKTGKPMMYLVALASILLIGSIVLLVINNNIQNKKITQLRDIVTQMQQTQPLQNEPDINQRAVHYPVEQQSAGLLAAGDSVLGSGSSDATQQQVPAKVNKPAKKLLKTSEPPIDLIDSMLVKEIKYEKPVIEQTGDKRVSVKRDETDKNLMQLVQVKPNDYKTGLLGGINNLKVTLYNKSLIALKKVEVQIDYLGPESRIVKTQTVFFENVGPGADLLLDVPKSNRGVKVNCTVKKISS